MIFAGHYRLSGQAANLNVGGDCRTLYQANKFVDFFFFRHVAGAQKPGRSLFVQRVISWVLFFVIFGGGPLWPGLLEELGIR